MADELTNGPVETTTETVSTAPGTGGLGTQVPGQAATVSTAASATGGIGPGHFIESDIDREIYDFNSDDTPMMQLMLQAKRVVVTSPEVEHYALDEPRCQAVTVAAVGDGTDENVVLKLNKADRGLFQPFTTVLVKGVDGYDAKGKELTPGKELMLFVTGATDVDKEPIVMAVNGKKTNETDAIGTVPEIPAGTTLIILGNALYETQKNVAPNIIVPSPNMLYCQKRGFSSIVSDYFEAQRKHIPFSKALIAQMQIKKFKCDGNRTLWAGRPSKFPIDTKLGVQYIYTTEGVRWQIRRHLDKTGKWTYEEFIALAKMIFTGDDVPKSVIILAGKNFVENIQTIDFSKHPEVQITVKQNKLGWEVTNIHTIFGDLEFKLEPCLNRLGWSNSAAVINYSNGLVHYVYSAEHKSSENIEGEEAKRESTVVWDALGLKGNAHIWIDGEGNCSVEGQTTFELWGDRTEPANPTEGKVYVLMVDCPGIDPGAMTGQSWQYKDNKWIEYAGEIKAS
ncbi:MAG: hypothetical protein K2K81_07435 [Muribaculaceae bacterium]|nr:hypothetical protein [Muribaculaceae bacterium]